MGALADQWRDCARAPGDNASWERLLNSHGVLFSRIVVHVAHRFGITNTIDIDDALQEVCLNISSKARLGKVPEHADDNVLEAYLKASIANAAHDYFRRQRAMRRDVLVTIQINEDLDTHRQAIAGNDLDHRVLIHQIEHMVEGSVRDRSVFLLYFKHGWTAREISAIPSVSLTAKGVESLVVRMIAAVRARVLAPEKPDLDKGIFRRNA